MGHKACQSSSSEFPSLLLHWHDDSYVRFEITYFVDMCVLSKLERFNVFFFWGGGGGGGGQKMCIGLVV